MYNVTPPVPHLPAMPGNVQTCPVFDASTLLYQPAVRAAVVQEQVAKLATRLAVARWTSGSASPAPAEGHAGQPFRAAFYARAQQEFFAWIERGGVWEAERGEAIPLVTSDAQHASPPSRGVIPSGASE